MIGHITDHIEQAKARLIWQWKDKRNLVAVVSAINAQVQALEDTLQEILALNVETAGGVNLDVIGAIVGVERAGRLDVDYRKIVKVQIIANKSHGKPFDLRAVAHALFGAANVRFGYSPPHSVQLTALTEAGYIPQLEKDILESAADAVTRIDIHFSAQPAANRFTWGSTDAFDDSAQGFSEGDGFDNWSAIADGGEMVGDI
jgi:hypothetical protein